ncbi:MAG: class I SAM-dependent methyltransferase, partial [Thaumarchaeota archaeon]|nr:class I SAM-dependent methyltransferase [Nitrososphaerota archaeon]
MSKDTCPLCGGLDRVTCLDRPQAPVLQNAIYSSLDEARSALTAPLAIRQCAECGFVFNAAFEPALMRYGEKYENDQTASGLFAAHVEAMALRVVQALRKAPDALVLEVGCGQGYFLRRLSELSGGSTRAMGFDPAWRGGHVGANISISDRTFDSESAKSIRERIDVVVCRHVIEHIPDPLQFLRSIHQALEGPNAVEVFFETPCVEWILRGGVLQDFFYEHCSYFSAVTLRQALQSSGFDVQQVEHVFGGQYLWASAVRRPGGLDENAHASRGTVPDAPRLASAVSTELTRIFSARYQTSVSTWPSQLLSLGKRGRVALWGAGAKGVTFAVTIDPAAQLIDCLIDLNPAKQSGFSPVTCHPIVSPELAAKRQVRSVIVMNPNYRDEIAARVA